MNTKLALEPYPYQEPCLELYPECWDVQSELQWFDYVSLPPHPRQSRYNDSKANF